MEINHSDERYYILLLMGVVIMVAFMLVIVIFTWIHQKKQAKKENELVLKQTEYQRKLLESSIQREEKERLRIAQDLHDNVGAQLSAGKFYIESMQEEITDEELSKKLTLVVQLISESIQSIREISKSVSPPLLQNYGLAKALSQYCQLQETVSKVDFEFTSKAYTKKPDLVELMIFRISQEIISNALKHGSPNQLRIKVIGENEGFLVEICDNGTPFNLSEKLKLFDVQNLGSGLKNIESRLQNCGAALYYKHEFGFNRISLFWMPPSKN